MRSPIHSATTPLIMMASILLLAGCGQAPPTPPPAAEHRGDTNDQAESAVQIESDGHGESVEGPQHDPGDQLAEAIHPADPPGQAPSDSQALSDQPSAAESPWRGLTTKIKIKNGAGETAMSVKPKEDGGKLVDAQEQELARYTVSAAKLKIKDAQDNVLGYVVANRRGLKLEDPTQQHTQYHLIDQGDGDWKLEDGEQHLLYKIKQREYGFEIETGEEASLFKVKVNGDKTSLRNAREETVYYTNDPVKPLAFACLGLEAIQDMRLRMALFTMIGGRP